MNACVIGFAEHSILTFPMSIPTSFINSAETFPSYHQLFLRSFPFFRRPFLSSFPFFSSDLLSAYILSLLKYTVSSFGFVIFPSSSLPPTSCFLPVFFCFMCFHLFVHFHSSQQSQRHFKRGFCFNVVFLIVFFSLITFPLCTRYVMSRGINDLLPTSSDVTAAVCFPSHFIPIVFPLIIFT